MDKSTKRKSMLENFCSFCDVTYKQIVNTRWLSLETAIRRNLDVYDGAKGYFLSSSESQARFQRLKVAFENLMSELYLLFYQAVLPQFAHTSVVILLFISNLILIYLIKF